MLLDRKCYEKHYIFLKATFQLPFSIIRKFCEQKAAININKYGLHICCLINSWDLQKSYMLWSHKLLVLLFHYWTCCFQMCTENFSNFSSFLWSCLKCVKRDFCFCNKFKNVFLLIGLGLVCIQLNIRIFRYFWKLHFYCFSNVITMHIVKKPAVFKALPRPQSSLRQAANFKHAFCMTQRLQISNRHMKNTLICSTDPITYFLKVKFNLQIS